MTPPDLRSTSQDVCGSLQHPSPPRPLSLRTPRTDVPPPRCLPGFPQADLGSRSVAGFARSSPRDRRRKRGRGLVVRPAHHQSLRHRSGRVSQALPRFSIIATQRAARAEPRSPERTGPQLRLPSGGYRQAATTLAACAADSTVGTMTPSAPASNAEPMTDGVWSGTLTSVSTSYGNVAATRPARSPVVAPPCCMSTQIHVMRSTHNASTANGSRRRLHAPNPCQRRVSARRAPSTYVISGAPLRSPSRATPARGDDRLPGNDTRSPRRTRHAAVETRRSSPRHVA